ncbi:phosphonopyruvate decarboxylase [Emcibacteraceae bacterium]|nr:phosphonopyruvate decarboxylase [Emcibacteraceae bacterium]
MVCPAKFYDELTNAGVNYFAGVPDSLLKTFCAFVSDNVPVERHVIAANEGAAMGLAMGYHLASDNMPLVYMQNSGLGNIVNPLMSLVDEDVYSIPMILMIGWRGEPGKKDEPQHVKQGKVTLATLEAMGIPYSILDGDEDAALEVIKIATKTAKKNSSAYALVIKKGCFGDYSLQSSSKNSYTLTREAAIKQVVDALDGDDIVVATTGMASRELFEYREELGQTHEKDFLTVGGMGHASQIALGIAAQKSERNVVCIDGDGASIMHMGSMAIIGQSGQKNFKHIVINNGAHDSVGGQATVGFNIDLCKIAEGCGYSAVLSSDNAISLADSLASFLKADGPSLLEIKVRTGNRKDLGRPTTTPQENKKSFMKFVETSVNE